MSTHDREDLFGQLEFVCRQHPLSRKILLSPKQESGRSLIEGLARRGTSATGLETATVQRLARRQATLGGAESTETMLAGGAGRLVMAQVLGERPEETVERRVADATHRLRQIQELRHRSWEGNGEELGSIYERYEAHLQEHGLLDGPALLRQATEILQDGAVPEIKDAVLILLPGLTTYPDEARYVDALCSAAAEAYQLGESSSEAIWAESPDAFYHRDGHALEADHRPGVAAEALRDDSALEQRPADVTPIRASTPEVEVEAALREIKRRGLSLDEVEVAYVASDPYLNLWTQKARQLQRLAKSERLPVTFGGGVPPRQTRAGRSLLAYFQLVENGPESPRLVRMLRSNVLQRVVLHVDCMCTRLQLPETTTIVAPDLLGHPDGREPIQPTEEVSATVGWALSQGWTSGDVLERRRCSYWAKKSTFGASHILYTIAQPVVTAP